MSIADLIERLEAATGPDGELDIDIYKLFGLGKISPDTVMEYKLDHDGEAMWRCRHAGQDWGGWWHAERYTASLDAAMTLVPENHTFDICICPEMGSVARIYFGSARENSAGEPTGSGHTPAVSICIAALKARGGDE